MTNVNNKPELKQFRKYLRQNLTPAEAKMWTYLKNSQLDGRKFRRQHSVARYILDFYCPAERLAIELDGEGHFNEIALEYDNRRDTYMAEVGIKVIRFENKQIFEQYDYVMLRIKSEFGWYEK